MPLRDHFHLPAKKLVSWESVHGGWPTMMAFRLNETLPPEYRSDVKIHMGALVEVDVAASEFYGNVENEPDHSDLRWQVSSPTLMLETEELSPAEYEVKVYDLENDQRIVAAIELVSPSNKDRPTHREAFISKCHALLQQDVCVTIVDTVTSMSANLYAELASKLGGKRPATADSAIYAVTCRKQPGRRGIQIQSWEHELTIGSRLPTLPLWLNETLAVPLELEMTYEQTLKGLRVA